MMLDMQLARRRVDRSARLDSRVRMLVQPSGLMGRNVWQIELCQRHLFCW